MTDENTNNCFVCMERTANKVCSTCNCVAHHNCWNQFINNANTVELIALDEDGGSTLHLKHRMYVSCPICRSKINTLGVVRRSQTKDKRLTALTFRLNEYANAYDDNSPFITLDKMMHLFMKHKSIVRSDNELSSTCTAFLKRAAVAFPHEYHTQANFVHLILFGTQF
jgi:hypothetical protein